LKLSGKIVTKAEILSEERAQLNKKILFLNYENLPGEPFSLRSKVLGNKPKRATELN